MECTFQADTRLRFAYLQVVQGVPCLTAAQRGTCAAPATTGPPLLPVAERQWFPYLFKWRMGCSTLLLVSSPTNAIE